MPELHFFGFGDKTEITEAHVAAFLIEKLGTEKDSRMMKQNPDLLADIVLVGHPSSTVRTLKLAEAPYILIQSSDQREAVDLHDVLRKMANPYDLVVGAELLLFTPANESS